MARFMKTIKVSELTGTALDWAVAKCEGVDVSVDQTLRVAEVILDTVQDMTVHKSWVFKPSTNWAQGGSIIEREGIDPDPMLDENNKPIHWVCFINCEGKTIDGHGPTPLEAAMRCYVASKLGDTVDVPKELTT